MVLSKTALGEINNIGNHGRTKTDQRSHMQIVFVLINVFFIYRKVTKGAQLFVS